ncbi:28S ribosomal protein S18b, mitochondrial-like [Uloborus diversus]|uniref:28S ribosomal protein S18b, mitochondrial-like n=1 Tax=Uloborus diversus TaxID=327109 RepID=UPI0024090C29|nr:28S ribosomal protein S18b, mitochondrial-like [Uloborus diversus]
MLSVLNNQLARISVLHILSKNKNISRFIRPFGLYCEPIKGNCQYEKILNQKLKSLFNFSESKQFSTSFALRQETEAAESTEEKPKRNIDPSKDRTQVISPETSIRYLKSKAYKTTYGDEPVWVKYRRNFRGQFTPRKTRETCIRGGQIMTGSPCPICRDEYLVLHYTNIDLLKQFIHPYTGEILSTRKTHVCQKRLLELEIAVKIARDHGLLTFEVPFRKYDYSEYYPNWKKE